MASAMIEDRAVSRSTISSRVRATISSAQAPQLLRHASSYASGRRRLMPLGDCGAGVLTRGSGIAKGRVEPPPIRRESESPGIPATGTSLTETPCHARNSGDWDDQGSAIPPRARAGSHVWPVRVGLGIRPCDGESGERGTSTHVVGARGGLGAVRCFLPRSRLFLRRSRYEGP
jgi:hypothetical protein